MEHSAANGWRCSNSTAALRDDVPSAKLTLVLSNVDFIDPDGEQLLHRMADDDVEFVAAGCMNRYVIDRLKRAAHDVEQGSRQKSRVGN